MRPCNLKARAKFLYSISETSHRFRLVDIRGRQTKSHSVLASKSIDSHLRNLLDDSLHYRPAENRVQTRELYLNLRGTLVPENPFSPIHRLRPIFYEKFQYPKNDLFDLFRDY